MCGIAGIIDADLRDHDVRLRSLAENMASQLGHRGPDATGSWTDAKYGVAFGHRRLSIVDLSPAGAQPMTSHCGTGTIAYNGEIYNASELRAELAAAGRSFRGHSDTEVILEACCQWGVDATVRKLIGMFAFALWDQRKKTVTIVRDRLGIKPLYWSICGSQFYFASELKAIQSIPDWRGAIDPESLAALLVWGYVPAPRSIYTNIQKLEPGKLLEFGPGFAPEIRSFWSLADVAQSGQRRQTNLSDEEAVDELERLLLDATKRRMVADVPLGAFLSGGIDSSTVTALMQSASDRPIRTFSIGFNEDAFDEASNAKAVAHHLGTDHTELFVTSEDTQNVIPKLPTIYDEPFADSSQVPTFLLSQLTREHVTVALSGDGGDELFGGYARYSRALALSKSVGILPGPVRSTLATCLLSLMPQTWDRILHAFPAAIGARLSGDKIHKIACALTEDDVGIYNSLISQWDKAWCVIPGSHDPSAQYFRSMSPRDFLDHLSWMQFIDMFTYLPDDVLTKVDRASMSASLEARVPLLDHRIVEFAWSLPARMKIRNGTTKWLLKQVLYRHLPANLFERPKKGFSVPIGEWLRGPLREWAEDLLSEQSLSSSGLIFAQPVREKWAEHQSGHRNWQYFLWNVLMFQAWYRDQENSRTAAPRLDLLSA